MQLKKKIKKESKEDKRRIIHFNQPFRKYEKELKALSERLSK